jgi:hypothetical protein
VVLRCAGRRNSGGTGGRGWPGAGRGRPGDLLGAVGGLGRGGGRTVKGARRRPAAVATAS